MHISLEYIYYIYFGNKICTTQACLELIGTVCQFQRLPLNECAVVLLRHTIAEGAVHPRDWRRWWGAHSPWPLHRDGWALLQGWRGVWMEGDRQVPLLTLGFMKRNHKIECWLVSLFTYLFIYWGRLLFYTPGWSGLWDVAQTVHRLAAILLFLPT